MHSNVADRWVRPPESASSESALQHSRSLTRSCASVDKSRSFKAYHIFQHNQARTMLRWKLFQKMANVGSCLTEGPINLHFDLNAVVYAVGRVDSSSIRHLAFN
jgi:hypothetical protein